MPHRLDRRVPVAVLISGRGSNYAALARAAERPGYPARIAAVIADRPDAPGLHLVPGIPSAVVDRRTFATRELFETALELAVLEARAAHIALAGFMRILSPAFVERWRGRIINIHPSLLPAFRGLDTHRRALAAGVKLHGATAHVVTAELDDGPILAQAAVPVLPGDTEATLAARVLAAEHRLYPAALATFLTGEALPDAAPEPLFNPPLRD